jgi:hypothetical protein
LGEKRGEIKKAKRKEKNARTHLQIGIGLDFKQAPAVIPRPVHDGQPAAPQQAACHLWMDGSG